MQAAYYCIDPPRPGRPQGKVHSGKWTSDRGNHYRTRRGYIPTDVAMELNTNDIGQYCQVGEHKIRLTIDNLGACRTVQLLISRPVEAD